MKGQRFGVNVLFGALLLVVVGSLTGELLSVNHKLSGDAWFYFGHQGYEYIDLGRVWQIALTIGLFLWVYLIGRNIMVAILRNDEHKSLLCTLSYCVCCHRWILYGWINVGKTYKSCYC